MGTDTESDSINSAKTDTENGTGAAKYYALRKIKCVCYMNKYVQLYKSKKQYDVFKIYYYLEEDFRKNKNNLLKLLFICLNIYEFFMNLPGKYKFKIEDYEEEEDEDEDEEHLKRRLPLSIVNIYIYNMMYEERKWYYNINKT
ncbi:hypothetical protein PFTANZ_02320 [Plasmodium falciparum Tanzania (2000708)]|uniref:Uncharacterized protein n=1 Tax=Plasmodium falciparum Tanzania (2000708) TaxID=1036725 RepID=A0A024WA14_PLAFA|nr:hypothetical protein PFTANZ_02320 [Plasmodium falciparum Tanzania (2000708)]